MNQSTNLLFIPVVNQSVSQLLRQSVCPFFLRSIICLDGQEDEAGCQSVMLLIGQSASLIFVVYSGAPLAEGARAEHHG